MSSPTAGTAAAGSKAVPLLRDAAPGTAAFLVPDDAPAGTAYLLLGGSSRVGVVRCSAGNCLARKSVAFPAQVTIGARQN